MQSELGFQTFAPLGLFDYLTACLFAPLPAACLPKALTVISLACKLPAFLLAGRVIVLSRIGCVDARVHGFASTCAIQKYSGMPLQKPPLFYIRGPFNMVPLSFPITKDLFMSGEEDDLAVAPQDPNAAWLSRTVSLSFGAVYLSIHICSVNPISWAHSISRFGIAMHKCACTSLPCWKSLVGIVPHEDVLALSGIYALHITGLFPLLNATQGARGRIEIRESVCWGPSFIQK
ncbi:hypothetical protein F4859DRAFT_466180 [Xylaria cf. heliscus]|nr:hypothetical protein F4859DRAFT_466180 [Xylaria cf. heliscus]